MTVLSDSIKNIHFVGIKGVGLAALAQVARDTGMNVTGSDVPDSFITEDSLHRAGITWTNDFNGDNLPSGLDLVVYTAAHGGAENPQVLEAQKRGVRVMNYGKALTEFFKDKKIIAVAGTHGKTTTTAMLATILSDAGLDPSWVVGTGHIPTLPSNGHYGKGDWAVVEADEYIDEPGGRPKFLHLSPYGLIVTSLDWDHPDVFPTPKHFVNAFKKLIKRVRKNGVLVLKGDEKHLRRLTKTVPQKVRWVLQNKYWHNLKLNIPGQYNLLNATFAATMAHELGVQQAAILRGLSKFQGLERRMQFKGTIQNWRVYDDYAHHPTEIKAALKALREEFPKSFICVLFQSHTYSRTAALLKDFAQSFAQADKVLVAPTFSSAREKTPAETVDLAFEIAKFHTNTESVNQPADLTNYLAKEDSDKDKVLITMGAGDIYLWPFREG